jgi:hypothetical protein
VCGLDHLADGSDRHTDVLAIKRKGAMRDARKSARRGTPIQASVDATRSIAPSAVCPRANVGIWENCPVWWHRRRPSQPPQRDTQPQRRGRTARRPSVRQTRKAPERRLLKPGIKLLRDMSGVVGLAAVLAPAQARPVICDDAGKLGNSRCTSAHSTDGSASPDSKITVGPPRSAPIARRCSRWPPTSTIWPGAG